MPEAYIGNFVRCFRIDLTFFQARPQVQGKGLEEQGLRLRDFDSGNAYLYFYLKPEPNDSSIFTLFSYSYPIFYLS